MSINKLSLEEEIKKGIKLFETNKLEESIKLFNKLREHKETKIFSTFFLGIIEIKKTIKSS